MHASAKFKGRAKKTAHCIGFSCALPSSGPWWLLVPFASYSVGEFELNATLRWFSRFFPGFTFKCSQPRTPTCSSRAAVPPPPVKFKTLRRHRLLLLEHLWTVQRLKCNSIPAIALESPKLWLCLGGGRIRIKDYSSTPCVVKRVIIIWCTKA